MAHTRTSSKASLDERQSAPATEAVEDYAKAIYALAAPRATGPVTTSALAERLGVAPSSVTAMLKRLDELGLVRYEPYHGVTLTAAGERVALEVIRHHRLIEAFLAETLGNALGPRPRRGRGARALHLGGPRAADRRQARQPDARPPRRPDPDARARLAADRTTALAELRGRSRSRPSRASPTPTRGCCAISPSAGSAPASRLRVTGARAVRRAALRRGRRQRARPGRGAGGRRCGWSRRVSA